MWRLFKLAHLVQYGRTIQALILWSVVRDEIFTGFTKPPIWWLQAAGLQMKARYAPKWISALEERLCLLIKPVVL